MKAAAAASTSVRSRVVVCLRKLRSYGLSPPIRVGATRCGRETTTAPTSARGRARPRFVSAVDPCRRWRAYPRLYPPATSPPHDRDGQGKTKLSLLSSLYIRRHISRLSSVQCLRADYTGNTRSLARLWRVRGAFGDFGDGVEYRRREQLWRFIGCGV